MGIDLEFCSTNHIDVASPTTSGTSGPNDSNNGRTPPSHGGGSDGVPPLSGWVSDLFSITKSTHTMESHLEHPDLRGLSAGAAHTSPDVELKPRDYAAEQNALMAADNPKATAPYHEDRPVIQYRTDMATDGLRRVWGPDAPITDPTVAPPKEAGGWGTRLTDIQRPDGTFVSGEEVKVILSTPYPDPPTYVSTVQPPVGTLVEASKPISDKARQYRFAKWTHSWFQNKKTLG